MKKKKKNHKNELIKRKKVDRFYTLPLILDWTGEERYVKLASSPTATMNIGNMMCVR